MISVGLPVKLRNMKNALIWMLPCEHFQSFGIYRIFEQQRLRRICTYAYKDILNLKIICKKSQRNEDIDIFRLVSHSLKLNLVDMVTFCGNKYVARHVIRSNQNQNSTSYKYAQLIKI